MRFPYLAPEEGGATGQGSGSGKGGDPTKTVETPAVVYDWHTDIHPDVKDDEVWKSVPDVKTLTKAYADANRYNVGAIKMPGKDATPEDWSNFHKKLGRPESVEGYTLHEQFKDDPTAIAMRAVAHSAGLTPAQWEKVSEGWGRIQNEGNAASAASRDETVASLRGEWGAAYDRKIGLVQRMIRTYGGEETFGKLSTNAIGNDPGFLKLMASVAEAMAEEELISKNVDGAETIEDAQKELDVLTASKAYLKNNDPGHAAAVKRATQLFEMVYN